MRSWLFTILHNQFVNTARRAARRPDRVPMEVEHEGLQPVRPEQGGRHVVRDITRAIEKLPEDQRQIILLIGLEGLSYEEAADVLSIPIGTVMSRLSRARRRLREILEGDEIPNLSVVK